MGGHLARAAVARGYEVLGIGVQSSPPATRPLLADERIVDMRDLPGLTQALAALRPAAVVHLAGQSSVAASIERPVETFEANAAGTWNLLEAVRVAVPSARILIVGSADCYGPQVEGSRVREDAPLRPVSPYGLSKAIADAAASSYSDQVGLDVVRTRSFAHIGPGQAERFMVPALARQIAEIDCGRRERVLHVGNLDITRDLTPVDSIAEGYLALLERGRAGCAYNVCSGRGVKLSDLAGRLVRRARVPVQIEVDPQRQRPADIPYLVGDPSAIARDTGWEAAADLDEALNQVLDEWRARLTQP